MAHEVPNITLNNGVEMPSIDSAQRADYRQMIEVNLLGAITATEVFLDQLKNGGDIINISSVAGRTARSGNCPAAAPSSWAWTSGAASGPYRSLTRRRSSRAWRWCTSATRRRSRAV
jgi:NADP-dependent 3-hydroxy acid dehydrogenase YdfG